MITVYVSHCAVLAFVNKYIYKFTCLDLVLAMHRQVSRICGWRVLALSALVSAWRKLIFRQSTTLHTRVLFFSTIFLPSF